MVGIESPAPRTHCHGCGRPRHECSGEAACGRGEPHDPLRFCPACGDRLREIVVVPGTPGLWCRTHGVRD